MKYMTNGVSSGVIHFLFHVSSSLFLFFFFFALYEEINANIKNG